MQEVAGFTSGTCIPLVLLTGARFGDILVIPIRNSMRRGRRADQIGRGSQNSKEVPKVLVLLAADLLSQVLGGSDSSMTYE